MAAMVACLSAAGPAGAETIHVTVDKVRVLRIDRPVATVSIGNNEIASVSVESLRLTFLTGKTVGETNLVILDGSPLQVTSQVKGVFVAGRPFRPESRQTRFYKRYRRRLKPAGG